MTLAVLSVAGLAFAMLSSAVVPALPTIQHDLHTSENGVTWVLTAYLLSASVGTAIIGRLGDMYGKERLLVWTLVVLSAGTLLAGVSSSLALLIVARAIQGVGGGIFPLAFGIIRDEFPRERVAGSIGLMSALLGIGGGVGILAGAAIVEHLSWHWLFWLPLVLIVVAAVCTWRFVPESPVRVPGRINWVAAVLMSAGMTLVLIAISETTTWGWGSAKTIIVLVVGGGDLRRLGRGRGRERAAVDRHDAHARPRGLDCELDGVSPGCGHVRVVRRLPAVRAVAEEHRLRVRRLRGRFGALSSPVDDRHVRRRLRRGPHRRALRVEARARRRVIRHRRRRSASSRHSTATCTTCS